MSYKIAISPGSDHRLAALFYDQVLPVAPLNQVLPEHMRFHGLDDFHQAAVINDLLPYMLLKEHQKRLGPDGLPNFDGPLRPQMDNTARNLFARHLHHEMSARNIPAVPLFLDDDSYQGVIRPGEGRLLEIVLENAPIIDLDDLSWDHIDDVRQDPDFKITATRFLLCLQEKYAGKDAAFVSDSIQLKFRDFEEAAKRQGLAIGHVTLKTLLEANSEFAIAAAGAVALIKGLSAAPLPTILASGGIVLGKVVLSIYEKLKETSEKDNNEIALLMDVKKSLEKR